VIKCLQGVQKQQVFIETEPNEMIKWCTKTTRTSLFTDQSRVQTQVYGQKIYWVLLGKPTF